MASVPDIAALRDRIRRLETPARHGILPFGVAAIDRALPGRGLALGAVHEILGQGSDEEDGVAAAGFAAGIVARLGEPPSPIQVIGHSGGLRRTWSGGGSPEPMHTEPAMRARRPRQAAVFMDSGLAPSGRPGMTVDETDISNESPGKGRGRSGAGNSAALGAGPILWCLKRSDLYGPGLLAFGLDPARLVIVRATRDDDMLWAVEEGLRCPGLAAVIGEVGRLPMVAGRRLQLAAERSGVTALLLRRWRNAREAAAERTRPSAAATRWRVAALPSIDGGEPGIGKPRWRVELLRCRGGEAANWIVETTDATGALSLSTGLADRPAAPRRHRADPVPERLAG